MVRRGWWYLAVASLVLVPVELATVPVANAKGPAPAGPGAGACTTWCLWDQPKFAGHMVQLTDGTCKDFPVKSAANNSPDDGGKTAMFLYRQPGCQGKPFNPFGMKSKAQSAHVDAVSAVVKPTTR